MVFLFFFTSQLAIASPHHLSPLDWHFANLTLVLGATLPLSGFLHTLSSLLWGGGGTWADWMACLGFRRGVI